MNDGGPAFPGVNQGQSLTVRDYFAARALQGHLQGYSDFIEQYDAEKLAEQCYLLADAMLAARENK